MKIKELFLRDIERHINPAVTVDSFNKTTVEAEISEYIFTDELIEKLYTFLNTVFYKQNGKTGVWINGYYGSGKSHFIKFAHYCMASAHTLAAFAHYLDALKNYKVEFSDATLSSVDKLKNKIANCKAETIIFNVEAVASNSKSKKERLTEIFLKQLNRHRGYNAVNIPVALYLEKNLHKQGKFEEFKQEIAKKFNLNWDLNANDLISLKLKAVLEVAKIVDQDIDVEVLRSRITANEGISIKDTLIPELVDYLENKTNDFRLVFMVDEISQFIGNDISLLLNLQTIVEAIEEPCKRRVWLVTTAQQTLEDVVNIIKNSNTVLDEEAVGKILGRFETRIALESHNADYITQKRVLDKKEGVRSELEYYYTKNKEEISQKFIFMHSAYKSYNDIDSFKLAYPFVPYQFKLISDVFDAFSSAGYVIKEVKDNERSVLGITHKTVRLFAENEMGDFVPFDAFFNETFKANLTHKARRMLQPAVEMPYVKNNEFAERVVRALFMIANISSIDKQKFSSNLDNLVVLLYSNLNENKNELQAKIQEVLAQLIMGNYIYEEDGNYFFYKEEEMDVASGIKNISPSLDNRYSYFYDIIKELLKNDSKTIFNSNPLSLKFYLDDKAFNQKGDIDVKFLVFASKGIVNVAMANNDKSLVFAINEWFDEEKELYSEFIQYIKTALYIAQNNKDGSTDHKRTIEKFAERNKKSHEAIVHRVRSRFSETPLVSGNQVIKAEEVLAKTPDARYKRALEMHFERVYKYSKLAEPFAQNSDVLKQKLNNTQLSTLLTDNELVEAERRIVSKMEQNGYEILLSDLCEEFNAPPFGWKDIAVIDIVRSLSLKKVINIGYRNEERMELSDFITLALKTQERKVISIKPGDKISQEELNRVIVAANNIFNIQLGNYTDAYNLFNHLKSNVLEVFLKKCEILFSENAKWPFAKTVNKIKLEFTQLHDKRDPKRFFTLLFDKEKQFRNLYDNYMELSDFINDNFADYKEIYNFIQLNKDNFNSIGDTSIEKYDWIIEFYKTEEMPVSNFKLLKKKHAELTRELNEAVLVHRGLCREAYQNVLETLTKSISDMQLNDSLLLEGKQKIKEIESIENITRIKLELSGVAEFQTSYLEKLIAEKAKIDRSKPEVETKANEIQAAENSVKYQTTNKEEKQEVKISVEMPAKKNSARYAMKKSAGIQFIKSKQDIDTYVEKLRKDLTELLNEAETIILE